MIKLRYGNTNIYFVAGAGQPADNNSIRLAGTSQPAAKGLLIDTDYAGTFQAFFKALGSAGLSMSDITHVMATHYHPDHSGLIGELQKMGVKLVLLDVQEDHVHFADSIFDRDKITYTPIDEDDATVISCAESRAFLTSLGISGEIIHTPSHSEDSISLILDGVGAFVGDLEPYEYLDAYEENIALKTDWEQVMAFGPGRIYYSHMPLGGKSPPNATVYNRSQST